jgi:hypothetical protein
VILFDSANNVAIGDKTFTSLEGGWASLAGERAVRVSSIHDLSSDALWITNLTEEQFYRATLTAHPNFRSDGYFRSTLRHIYSELGVDPLQVGPDTVVAVLASIAQRLLDLSAARYGVKIRSKGLNEDFALALGAPRSTLAPEIYGLFAGAAQHAYVRAVATHSYVHNGQTLTLRRNRLLHARELLSAPVPPDAPWEYVPRSKLPVAKADVEGMLEKTSSAFLVRCEVKNISPLIADVFSVGGGARMIRDWLTSIEWERARQWGEIDYKGVLLCSAASAALPQVAKLPAGDYAPLSFTLGLAAEQIWTAMAMKRGPREDLKYTAAAAWLRAQDRMLMLAYAQRLHEAGLLIWGYGGGNVVVMVPDGGLRHALDVTTDTGLLAPANKLLEARRLQPIRESHGLA